MRKITPVPVGEWEEAIQFLGTVTINLVANSYTISAVSTSQLYSEYYDSTTDGTVIIEYTGELSGL